jgi:hypothetical protein
MIKVQGNTNNVVFAISEPIVANKDEIITVQVLSASIPYSFFNINFSNKYLNVYENHTNGTTPAYFTIVLEEGNYNIIQIAQAVQDALNTGSVLNHKYVVSYNKRTNKLTFSITSPNSVASFLFLTGTNQRFDLQYVLGFYKIQDYSFSHTSTLTSDSTCNVSPYDAIYIRSNIILSNQYDTKSKNLTDVLIRIPVNNVPFSFIQWNPTIVERYKTNLSSISTISFQLTDADGDPIDIQNNDFYISLRFDVEKIETVFDISSERDKLIRAYINAEENY